MKNINILLITFFLLTSCASLNDAGKVLRNEKIKTTDEFLLREGTRLFFHRISIKYLNLEQKKKYKQVRKKELKKYLKLMNKKMYLIAIHLQ